MSHNNVSQADIRSCRAGREEDRARHSVRGTLEVEFHGEALTQVHLVGFWNPKAVNGPQETSRGSCVGIEPPHFHIL